MAIAARWIRLEANGGVVLRAASAGFARAQSPDSAPAALWTEESSPDLAFALVVPLKFAPGRARRWRAWALSPLIAAYRHVGLRAYLEADGIRASGRRIAACEASLVGACAVVVSTFTPPAGRFLEQLRQRIESQHGWQFDHSWPSSAEKEVMLERVNAH